MHIKIAYHSANAVEWNKERKLQKQKQMHRICYFPSYMVD